jgi:hypothetical protein
MENGIGYPIVISLLTKSDPRASLKALTPHLGSTVSEYYLLSTWATTDATAAAEYALALPSGTRKESGINSVVRAWASEDSEAALAWIGELDDPALADKARVTYGLALAQKDPEGALKMLLAEPSSNERDAALTRLAKECTKDNPEAMLLLARDQDDSALRKRRWRLPREAIK